MARCTVSEVEELLEAALRREKRQKDLVAWQTAHLLNAAGSKTREGEPWTAERLLGRELRLERDPRQIPAPDEPEAEPVPMSDKAARAMAMIQEAELQRATRQAPPLPPTH